MSPAVRGLPIEITFLSTLRAHRGKLLSGDRAQGREVHAASFLRRRLMVLDSALKRRPRELKRIVTHELFHFAWIRLGNPRRRSYEDLIRREIRNRVEGELGWSAESAKTNLAADDAVRRTRRWREYVCESFCDSGAWLVTGDRHHEEFTLPAVARRARHDWFAQAGLTRRISV